MKDIVIVTGGTSGLGKVYYKSQKLSVIMYLMT